mmetsp:Transcript_35642/g.90657  ORF Transcript_35642/g.90657 Transcript_35642/m.90657 type:complete len:341 (-) Transcript_35642:562-1584(-)
MCRNHSERDLRRRGAAKSEAHAKDCGFATINSENGAETTALKTARRAELNSRSCPPSPVAQCKSNTTCKTAPEGSDSPMFPISVPSLHYWSAKMPSATFCAFSSTSTRAGEATNDLVDRILALGARTALEAACVVEDRRSNDDGVELVAGLQQQVAVELLARLVSGPSTAIGLTRAVLEVPRLVVDEPVDVAERHDDVYDQELIPHGGFHHTLVELHDAAATAMLVVPIALPEWLAVKAQEEVRVIAQGDAVTLPRLVCDEVAAILHVAETQALHDEHRTASTTRSLGGHGYNQGVRLAKVQGASGVRLDAHKDSAVRIDGHVHPQAVAGAMAAIHGRQV